MALNYTTALNIIFLIIATALAVWFFRINGLEMLKMIGEPVDHH